MDDKAPVHPACHTQAARIQQVISSHSRPESSSDLNRIQEVSCNMNHFLYRMDERPSRVPTIRAAVEDASKSIINEEIREIVDTKPARIQAILAARDGHTKY